MRPWVNSLPTGAYAFDEELEPDCDGWRRVMIIVRYDDAWDHGRLRKHESTELKRLVTDGESEQVEFKRSTGQRTEAMKAVCAMLNGLGGFVLFGVDDRSIIGQEVSARTHEDIAVSCGVLSHRRSQISGREAARQQSDSSIASLVAGPYI